MKNFIFVMMKGQQARATRSAGFPPCSSVQQASLFMPSGSLQTADRKSEVDQAPCDRHCQPGNEHGGSRHQQRANAGPD